MSKRRGLFRRGKNEDVAEPELDDLLDDLDELAPADEAPAAKSRRRGLFGRKSKKDGQQEPDLEDRLDALDNLVSEEDDTYMGIELPREDAVSASAPKPQSAARPAQSARPVRPLGRVTSVLAADFGSVNTRVVLVDVVEGAYRLVARGQTLTTDGFPAFDLVVGLDRALRELTQATNRRFMSDSGQIIRPEQYDRSGVDAFAVTASLGRPLRAVLVGLVPDLSLAAAMRVAAGAYIDVRTTLHLEDGRDEEAQLNTILLSYPDVILIAGGTDHGAKDATIRLMESVRTAIILLDKAQRPAVIYSGNQDLIETVEKMFNTITTILIADNIRPDLETEHLDSARLQLGLAFDSYKEQHSGSFAAIGPMSDTGVLPTAQSYITLAEYMERTEPGDVALVDVGSSHTVIAVTEGDTLISSIRTDIGLGHSAPQLLEAVGEDAVLRWVPFASNKGELQNYAMNKSLRPATIPMNLRELYLEQAMLRAGLQSTLLSANPTWTQKPLDVSRVVAAGGALTGTGNSAYDALLLLDCVQPAGVTLLQSDPYGMLIAMGAMATRLPEVVVQLLDMDNLVTLGTAISLDSIPRPERPAMKVTIKLPDQKNKIEQTVLGGHLWVYALPHGRSVEVQIRCYSGLTIQGQRSLKIQAKGGMVGLIFDARGRPVAVPVDLKERARQIPLWVHEVTGDRLQEISEKWLEEKSSEETAVVSPRRRKRRKQSGSSDGKGNKSRRRRGRGKKADDEEVDEMIDDILQDDDDDLERLRDALS